MKQVKNLAVIILVTLLSTTVGFCQKSNDRSEGPTNFNDGISTSTLESVHIQENVINEILDSISTGFYPNRHSLLIYKDDHLVTENYFRGQDYNWGMDIGIVEHGDNVLHDMRSVSKSIVSACIGIAISQGKIKSVDQPVFDFFEDYQRYNNEGREELTIKHLLTMTSGLEWNEDVPYNHPENSEVLMYESGDGVGFVLSRSLISKPGSAWNYNGGTTELLATIIETTTGKNVHEYAKEHIFDPMAISKSEWTRSPQTNKPAAASGLRLTSRDMLKFGILYQNEGKWNGKQIIPKEWVEASLKSYVTFGRNNNVGYGYQFWIFSFEIQGKSFELPTAVGNGDQRIFIDNENDLIVATTAGNYNMWNIKNDAEAILEKIYESFVLK